MIIESYSLVLWQDIYAQIHQDIAEMLELLLTLIGYLFRLPDIPIFLLFLHA
jgi:hypothetical protein